MQMNYSYASDLPFNNFCKLAKRAETIRNYQKQVLVMIKHCLANSQINRSKQFSYRTFLYKTNTKFTRITSRRTDFIHSQREIKEILDPEKHTFPLNQSIKVYRRALVLLLYLIPCNRCEKSARESRNFHHFVTQRGNIHARAQDTCVDQRGYMTSGWRNLF